MGAPMKGGGKFTPLPVLQRPGAVQRPMGMQRPMSMQRPMGMQGMSPEGQYLGRELDGELLQWKAQWGWISTPMFEGDIFAHIEDFAGAGDVPPPGTPIRFTVGHD